MARGKLTEDTTILQMALAGYKIEMQKIEAKIGEIQTQLDGKTSPAAVSEEPAPGTKRHLSAAALRRISIAQKKRWAAHRKRAAQAAKEA